jgi:hypothetical protein
VSAPSLDVPAVAGDANQSARVALVSRRSPLGRRLLAVAGVAAIIAGGTMVAAGLRGDPDRVAMQFGGDPFAVQSSWGDADLFGVPGSWVVPYGHGSIITMHVPWDGEQIADAWFDEDEPSLFIVDSVTQTADEVQLQLTMGNCRYFHERELDMFAGVHLVAADGDTTELLFDRPVIVHSPMLWGCPDRSVDRGDDRRTG